MKSPLLCFLLLNYAVFGLAQSQSPIYKTSDDSVKITQLTSRINELTSTPGTLHLPMVDSLRSALRIMQLRGIIGFRYKFEPDRSFTSLSDVLEGKVQPEKVKKLSITENPTRRLPAIIYQCKSLEALELLNTRLQKVPGRLKKLRHLKSLRIYNNVSSKRLRLATNQSVSFLKIRSSNGQVVPLSYRKLKNLDTLDLSRCNLDRFPDIKENRKLKQLLLGENRLNLKDLGKISNPLLEHLGLHRNHIDTVPPTIANFPALKKLVLNYNNISEVDKAFKSLKNLEELGLYSNKLKSIPEPIFQLRELRFLDLYYNEIERIPDAISNLDKLTILYLASNKIFSISDKIGELSNLRELYMHHNRISSFPFALKNLSNLEVFRFNSNRMVDVPEWITGLSHLKNIDFSQNNIHITPGHLLQLQNLQIVAMTENPWENFEKVEDLAEMLVARGVIVHLEMRK